MMNKAGLGAIISILAGMPQNMVHERQRRRGEVVEESIKPKILRHGIRILTLEEPKPHCRAGAQNSASFFSFLGITAGVAGACAAGDAAAANGEGMPR